MLDRLKTQYLQIREEKEQEVIRYAQEHRLYADKQKNKLEAVRDEMVGLFHVCSQ